jgi:hypothetical protein
MHAHMISRTTDDYEQMALSGCVAVTEPAFWAGYDRHSAAVFADYFHHLTVFEPNRAARFGIKHYAWLCLNPKEGEDRALAREVLKIIPEFLDHPNILGIGEIGLNRVTRNELDTFIDHVNLAVDTDQMILIHTPHLEDKYKGTKHIVDTLVADPRVKRHRVAVDHVEEHTIEMVITQGFWAGITLYPTTKCSPNRAIDMIEMYGSERIYVASACDWGRSAPLAVPHFIREMRRRGHTESFIRKIVYDNPIAFLSQNDRFSVPEDRIEVALNS